MTTRIYEPWRNNFKIDSEFDFGDAVVIDEDVFPRERD